MKNYIYLNSIMPNPSLCDGPGYRTVIFLQGCNRHCCGCHNQTTWNIEDGKRMTIEELAGKIRKLALNKKITISGGEPLLQKDSLMNLLELLDDFNICLYTSYELADVPDEILKHLTYLKVGPYIKELRTTTMPYVGSTNQQMLRIK